MGAAQPDDSCAARTARASIGLSELVGPQWTLPWLLNHRVSGEHHQETIVLIHGVTGDYRTFNHVAESLSQFYRVVQIDLRGMGNTPAYGWNYSSKMLAADIQVLLKHLEKQWTHAPGKYHILGHSFGGRVAIRFCDEYPEITRSLIVEDMHFATYNGASEATRLSAAKRAFSLLRSKNNGLDPRTLLDNQDAAAWKAVSDKEYVVPLFASEVRAEDYSAELTRLQAPVLLVGADNFGGALRPQGVAHAKRHLKNNPFVRITPIANTGHDVHNDNPDAYLNVVGSFIADVLRR